MMDFMPLEDFLHKFRRVYASAEKLKGTSLFLIKDVKEIPFLHDTDNVFPRYYLSGEYLCVDYQKG